jgi:CubicO group peptidase (beta-lactamase class C family)
MKTAAQSFLLLLLVVVALPTVITSGASGPGGKAEDAGLSPERLQRLSQMIQRRIAAGDLAGAVTVVARKGKVAYVSAQGVMDLESKQPMTEASMFRIASMTKPVVGVAIMMMVEEGKLRLNDPVSRYIPEFRGMKVAIQQAPAGGSGDETPVSYTVPAQREITVKDLLTHVSGLAAVQ